MPRLSLSLLGAFRLARDEEPLIGFESDKVRALLAYLAVEAEQPHRREWLVGLLWPDRSERCARQDLSQALFNLRQVLGDRQARPPLLLVTPQTIQFNQAGSQTVDTALFSGLITACAKHPHRRLAGCETCLEQLHRATTLYQGDFLEGFSLKDSSPFEEWSLLKREQFRRLLVDALRQLSHSYEQRGEYETGLPYARRWVALEPWQESAYRHLMRLLAGCGQRNAALAQYEVCRQVLAEELGVEPEEKTLSLYQRLRDEAVPPPVRPGPPHNLPLPLTPFVGRKAELARIKEQLQQPACRLLTLVGPGGAGKTRLALEAARTQLRQFTHGVYVVPLVEVTSIDALAPAVALAIHLSLSEKRNPQQQLLDDLRSKTMLLILDSFEHLISHSQPDQKDGVDWVLDVLSTAPDVTVLVTSRARLNVQGEHLIPIWGLDFPGENEPIELQSIPDIAQYDAVKLFEQSASQVQPDFELTAGIMGDVVQICRLVQGMPLAIVLAAAWLEILTPAEIVTRIGEGTRGHGVDFLQKEWLDVPARQRSMRVVFDQSWALLTEREREIFQVLTVFRGGFTHQAAQEITGASLPELRGLVNKSFLHYTPAGRYELHELVRQYGTEKLNQAPRAGEIAHNRHCAYYLAALQKWGLNLGSLRQQTILAKMDEEIRNADAAWAWAVEQGQWERLDQAVEGLGLFYQLRGRYAEGRAMCQAAVEKLAARASGAELQILAKILTWQGALDTLSEGRAYLERGLTLLGYPVPRTKASLIAGLAGQLFQQLLSRCWPGWFTGRLASLRANLLVAARAYDKLTEVYYFANEIGLTLYAVFRSLNLAEAAGLSPELARGCASAGITIGFMPLPNVAEWYFRRALEASQNIEDCPARMWVGLVAGIYYAGVGNWTQARHLLEQEIKIAETVADRYRRDDGASNLAMVAYLQGDFAACIKLSEDFYASAGCRHDTHNQAWALRGKVYSLLPQGKFTEALACLEELQLLLARETDIVDKALTSDLYGLLALAQLRRDEPDLALRAANEAVRLRVNTSPTSYLSLPGYAGAAETYLTLWEAEITSPSITLAYPQSRQVPPQDKVTELKSRAGQAIKSLRDYTRVFPIGQPRTYLWQGVFQWLSGCPPMAYKLWANSLTVAEELAMPYDQGLTHYEVGRHLPLTDPAHSRHLTYACHLFARLEASYDLKRAQQALQLPE